MSDNRRVPIFAAVILIAMSLPLCSAAAVHTVRQDGTGDHVTITSAVSAAAENDTIDVGPGTYREAVTIGTSLRIFSSSGPTQTHLDGEHVRRLFTVVSGFSVVRGISFENGYSSASGGAVRVEIATVRFRNCAFVANTSEQSGGAVCASGLTGLIAATDCMFHGNHANQTGGAGYAETGGRLTMSSCTFIQNSASSAGALACRNGILESFDSVYVGNSGGFAGALYYDASSGSVQRNTFHANASTSGATVAVESSPSTNVTRNIFSADRDGFGLRYVAQVAPHSCNIYWGNASGAVDPAPLADDEVEVDPMFCGAAAGNFTVQTDSPAAPAHNECGVLIGALPPSCDGVPTLPQTWGRIKAGYQR